MRADCPRAISKRCFADERGQSLLSRTAVSEITQRLWAQYEAFASRDLSEFEVIYLFVDGIAERLHLGQPREAVRFFLTEMTIAEIAVRPFFCSAAPRAILRSCSRHSNICFLGS